MGGCQKHDPFGLQIRAFTAVRDSEQTEARVSHGVVRRWRTHPPLEASGLDRGNPTPASWMEKVLAYRADGANPAEDGRMAALLTGGLSASSLARSTRSTGAARTALGFGNAPIPLRLAALAAAHRA
jgi:hypothetical protein